jgi:hypothetical protein
MTNVKYLKENNLYEAHKHFKRIVEGFGYGTVEEADDDQDMNNNDPMGGEQPQDAGGAPMGDPNAGGMPMDDPNAGGAPMDDPNAGGAPMGDPNADGMPMDEPPMDDSMGGDMPMDDGMPMDDAMGGDEEEVIDVEDITNAEEKVNDKVNAVGRDVVKVNHRIDQLLTAIEKMETMIDSNNNNIEALNQEFQKRNPTQTEKLNLRSLDSYPFNINPVDYWKEKSMNSNYDAYSDNQEPTTKEYVITNNDVDDMTERDMAQSFYVDDDLKQDINKIFGY